MRRQSVEPGKPMEVRAGDMGSSLYNRWLCLIWTDVISGRVARATTTPSTQIDQRIDRDTT